MSEAELYKQRVQTYFNGACGGIKMIIDGGSH